MGNPVQRVDEKGERLMQLSTHGRKHGMHGLTRPIGRVCEPFARPAYSPTCVVLISGTMRHIRRSITDVVFYQKHIIYIRCVGWPVVVRQRHLGAPRQPPGCRRLWAGFGAVEGVRVGLGCGVRGEALEWEWQCFACCCGPNVMCVLIYMQVYRGNPLA
jgi:hypothetical protein